MLQYYGNCGETETEYQKLGYILDTEAAYIIVDPEFPFMDLPYLHTGKPGQPRKQKFSKKGFKGFKEYRDQEEEEQEEDSGDEGVGVVGITQVVEDHDDE